MSSGIRAYNPAGQIVFDTTIITYSLIGTLYCPANGSASAVYETNGLAVTAQVFLTDSFLVTVTPTLASAAFTTNGNFTTCNVSGGTAGCTVLVFVS